VAYELLNACKKLHEKNIVHRDIKAANIFFANDIAKLGDLNVSKVADNGYCETHTGTPYYTSPEIWNGTQYTSKCDIWSLGCLVYEMCTLSPPFKATDFPSLFRKVIVGEYEQIPKNYSQELKDFIRECLTVDDK
jgi:NIMA (never in mitosis gene a)-related kinase 1/4/5